MGKSVHRERTLLLLFTLAAGCALFLGQWSNASLVRGVVSAVYVLGMPCVMYLTGVLLRWKDPRDKLRLGGGFFLLYGAEKVLSFWVGFACLDKPSFSVLKVDRISWAFLVLGVALLFASWAEQKQWRRDRVAYLALFIGAVALYAQDLGSYLGLSYLFTFGPLVLLGLWERPEQRDRVLNKKNWTLLALLICLVVLGICLLWPDTIWKLRNLFLGARGYGKIPSQLVHLLGGGVRIGHYLAAWLVANGLLGLMPDRRVPYVTGAGKHWYAMWFWLGPIMAAVEPLALPHLRLRGAGVITLVLLLLSGTEWAQRPVVSLVNGLSLLERPPRRLEPGASFFRRHRRGVLYVLVYTCAFALAGMGAAYSLVDADKSLVWDVDGLQQQYTSLLYFRNYVLDALSLSQEAGRLILPQFTFNGGQGMAVLDVIRKDPFVLFALLTDETHMEAMFVFLVFLRLWVAGLLFSWLCHEMGKDGFAPRICGALTYAFSGYAICVMVRQTSFLHTCLVNLPLILIGVERYLRKGKSGVFIFSVFLGSFNGYYATWMNSLMMGVWLLIRLIDCHGRDIKHILATIFKMVGLYLWGLCLAMVVFLPAVATLLFSGRGGTSAGYSGSMLYYNPSYYQTFLTTLGSGYKPVDYWTITGAAGIALLSVVLLFLRKNRSLRALKAGVIVSTVGLCIPFVGKVMNGFGYVSNRWCYGFALVIALTVTWMLPHFFHLSGREKQMLVAVTVVYAAIVLLGKGNDDIRRYYGLLMILATLLVALALETLPWRARQKQAALSLVVALSLVGNLALAFLPGFGNYLSLCLDAGTVQSTLETSGVTVADQIQDNEGFYRISQPQIRSNQATGLDYYGTTAYFSIVSAETSDYYNAFDLCTVIQTFDLQGLDARAALEALASVKYFLCIDGKAQRIPYGFTKVDTIMKNGTDYAVYENENFLSVGYTYEGVLTRSEFEALTPLERQQAILQYAVVEDDADLTGLTTGTPETELIRQEVTVEEADGVTIDWEAKTISVPEREGSDPTLTFSFAGTPDCETYLYLKGLEYPDEDNDDTLHLRCKAQGATATTYVHGKQHTYYFERDGVTYNLGYSEDGVTTCTLYFNQACELAFEDIAVYALPVSRFQTDVDVLKENQLENVVQLGDSVSGSITCDEKQLLATSIPYSKGWQVYVDGEEAELLQTNLMYCGVVLEPGTHQVEFRYTTPGLKAGATVSVAAFALLVLWSVVKWVWRRVKH